MMKPSYLLALLAVIAALHTACKKNVQPSDEWNLVWEESFDNGESFDTTYWEKIPRGHVDWNRYMSSNDSLFAIRDGKMILRGVVNTLEPNDTAPYITGGIQTKGKKDFRNGRLEVRAKLQAAKGAWPAIWLMPEDRTGDWPACGEIDIMERLNHDSIAYQTVHSTYTVDQGQTAYPVSGVTGPIDPEGFNTYAVELYPDSVVFFINDNHTNTYPRLVPEVPGQFPFDKDWYLKIDMQVGGQWVGPIDPEQLPVEMEIDWVRFYQK